MINRLIDFGRRKFWSGERYARYIGVKIGHNCHIGTKWFGTEPYLIEIGDHVQLTNGVRFFTHGGSWVVRKEFPDFDFFGKIKIGNNVYVGNCAMIMPGVTIEDNVIIAAGAVITKSVPAGSIIGGNPGRIIGRFEDFKKKHLVFNTKTAGLDFMEKKKILLAGRTSFIKKEFYKK